MKIINIWGAPSSGKTTLAAGLFHFMKINGYSCSLVQEFARDLIFEKRLSALQNQCYVAGVQSQRIFQLEGNVDYAVIDSPILLPLVYSPSDLSSSLGLYLERLHSKYPSFNFLLPVPQTVQQDGGRLQTIADVDGIHQKIVNVLKAFNIHFIEISRNTPFSEIVECLQN